MTFDAGKVNPSTQYTVLERLVLAVAIPLLAVYAGWSMKTYDELRAADSELSRQDATHSALIDSLVSQTDRMRSEYEDMASTQSSIVERLIRLEEKGTSTLTVIQRIEAKVDSLDNALREQQGTDTFR